MLRFRSIGVRAAAAAIVVILVGLGRPAALAQQPPVDFDALLAEAQKADTEQRWDAAAEAYGSIRDLAHQRGDEVWEARGRLGLGTADARRRRYAEARVELLAALKTFEERQATALIGRANDTLAFVADAIGDEKEKAVRSRRAMEAFEAAGDRRSHLVAALRLASATEFTNRAEVDRTSSQLVEEARALGALRLEGAALHHWADELFNIADYDAAIDKLEQAASAYEKADDSESLATVYTSLGRLYRVHGQPQAAVAYQLKSLDLAERFNTSPRTLVQSLNAVGVAYQALGDFPRAREYYERALAAAEKSGAAPIIEFLRAELGGFYVEAGEPERARVLLEDVVAHGSEQHLTLRYTQLSYAYYSLGRNEEARGAAVRALDSCPTATPLDCVYALLSVARAEIGLGHQEAALASNQAAFKTIEEIHGRLAPRDFLKQGFHTLWDPWYSIAIELQFRRGEFRAALETAELGRSRGFLDLLASRDLGGGTVPQLSALTLRGSKTTVRSQATTSAPNAGELAAIAARLHSTMVVYWVGRETLYTWIVSQDGGVRGATVNVTSSRLADLVRTTSTFTGRANPAWRELYDILIKPVERNLPRTAGARLTIVPHGALLHLPFAALRDAQGRYLVERYTIHSVPAAAILQFTSEQRHPNARSGKMLLVADPAAPPILKGEPPLSRLPGAVEEARAIARLVPASHTLLLADTSATDTRVRAALPRRSVLHFATHAIVRDADPLSSFLALGTGRDSDGKLTAERIYGLKIDADLVVLSACRSGDGLVTGDGIAGLARAFFYAGAPSLVVSLWDVADAPASRLVPTFYREWLHGAGKARALRSAQLQLIRELRAGSVKAATPAGDVAIPEDPAFWAGFILLGEPD